MSHSVLADGIFDFDEALVRIVAISIVPIVIIVIGFVLSAISKRRKK